MKLNILTLAAGLLLLGSAVTSNAHAQTAGQVVPPVVAPVITQQQSNATSQAAQDMTKAAEDKAKEQAPKK